MANPNKVSRMPVLPSSLEVTEAAHLTKLRTKCETYFALRLGKLDEQGKPLGSPVGRIMLKIGFLPKSTTQVKTSEGLTSDLVSKSFHVADATAQGENIKLITINERVGLSKTGAKLSKGEALSRVVGAVFSGMCEIAHPRERNKAGRLVLPKEYAESLKQLGWSDWRTPAAHGDRLIESLSPKIDLPVDAFELPKPVGSDTARMAFKVELRNEEGKLVGTGNISKSLYEGYREKVDKLHVTFKAVDAGSAAKANKLAKAAGALETSTTSEADAQAMLDKAIEQAIGDEEAEVA